MFDRDEGQRLARVLPDSPRWVETRSMLLSGQCEILGLEEHTELSFVGRNIETRLVSVVGHPVFDAIREPVTKNENQGAILALSESSDYVANAVPDWTVEKATIHVLGRTSGLPPLVASNVRPLAANEISSLPYLPADFKHELLTASRRFPVAATLLDGKPVSFCYAGAETETLWDISIDTLADYRNRGYASMCVAFMIRYMHERGKQPVWGALESNRASLNLAAKLGFVPVDRIVVFEPVSTQPE